MVEDELAGERLRRLDFFDPTMIGRLKDEHFARRHNWAGILWALLGFMTWHRLYLERSAAPSYRI